MPNGMEVPFLIMLINEALNFKKRVFTSINIVMK